MKKPIIILSLAILTHYLAWEAQLGLNALLFSSACILGVAWLKPQIFARREVKLLLAGWCLSSLWLVWHHSALSVFVYWTFGFVILGHLQQLRIYFWLFGLAESTRALFGGWLFSLQHFVERKAEQYDYLPSWQRVRLLVIPSMVVIPFYLIYSGANSTLSTFNVRLGEALGRILRFEFDWSRLLVFLLGWAVIAAVLGTRIGIKPLHQTTKNWKLNLRRIRSRVPWPVKPLALRREYQSAVLTFVALNGLLAIINLLDLIYVWFSPAQRTAAELSNYVHEGTWLLLFSIAMAMLVVLIFFRKNLNFITDNARLRRLAYLWLGQNVLLALSVGVRNIHYIQQYGLAHGRIIVMIFLLLVLFGLFSMYRKVRWVKTTFYLLQVNSAAVMVTLLLIAGINWDRLITSYNLKQEAPDNHYVTRVLDNNLVPLLEAAQQTTMSADQTDQQRLHKRGQRFAERWQAKGWRSWNYSEWQQYQAWQAYCEAW